MVAGCGGWVYGYRWGLLRCIECQDLAGPYICMCLGGLCIVCRDCDVLGPGVSVDGICQGMFVGLESVDYLVYIIVMSSYLEAIYVWVSASRE